MCGAVVGFIVFTVKFWGYRGGYSVSGTTQLMVCAGLGWSHSCISSCWRKRLRVGVACLVQQAGEKAGAFLRAWKGHLSRSCRQGINRMCGKRQDSSPQFRFY